jgi:toxin ParE1/3/4
MPRVFTTSVARSELDRILDYLRSKNLAGAARLRREFRRVFRILGRQPDIGTPCDHLGQGVRSISVENYVVLFRRSATQVEVLGVTHGARDWESLN